MTRRLASAAFLAVIVALATATVGEQRGSAECKTSEATGETTCWLARARIPNRAVPIGDRRTSSFLWMSFFSYNQANTPFLDPTASDYCRRTTVDGATTTHVYGNVYTVVLRNTTTGENVTAPEDVCAFDDSAPGLSPPAPPPTEAEFVEAARALATVSTSLNPRAAIGGLTGLDTWLWCDDPGEVEVGVSLRGWSASATLSPVEFAWAIHGTDSASFSAGACGSEASPAASWMPETMGPYSVTLTSTWAGTWTLAYNGLPAGTFPLGPFEFAAPAVAYPVDEYRGVLTPPGGEQ